MIATVTIAGMPVVGRKYGDHPWPRPLGVNAPMVVWCLPPNIAEKVLALKETEISILLPGNATPKVFKRVVVVCENPSDSPLKRYVVLSDPRWYLPRVYVKDQFNLRITTAQTQLLDVAGTPLEIDPVNYKVGFSGGTLKGDRPWTATEILEYVATTRLKIKLKKVTTRDLGQFSPPDVMLDGPGNIALAHALGHAGGVDVRVDDNGDFELVDALLGSEKGTIEQYIPYALRNKGFMRWISMRNVAPKSGQMGFDADMEVRGDGWLPAPGTSIDPKKIGNYPVFENVIKVTDKQLATTDRVSGKAYQAVIGSYLPADQWFSAVAADTVVPAPSPIPPQVTWSRAYACEDWFQDLMEWWFVTGNTGGLEPTAAWANRHGQMKQDLFKTWRLNPGFAALCIPGSIRPVRAQLLDPAANTRQPAAWFQDFCRKPTTRGVRDFTAMGWNVHNLPGTPSGQAVGTTKTYTDGDFPGSVMPLASCKQAPILARLLDPIAGIFTAEFKKDVQGHTAEQAPCLVQQLPTNDLGQVFAGVGIPYWHLAKLTTTHRVILVFSATPAAAPLYFVDVNKEAAMRKLGFSDSLQDAQGPVFQMRTGAGIQTARFQYADADCDKIQKIFDPDKPENAQSNLQSMTPVNKALLQDYADAAFAVLYAALLDHYEGEAQVGFVPDAMPQGSLQDVTHIVNAKGAVYTRFTAKRVTPAVQPIHFMERGHRATILRNPGNYQ